MLEYKEVERTLVDQGTSMEKERFNHPAFGMIGFSRVSGGENILFGSNIKHNNKIVMRLKHGDQDRYTFDEALIGLVCMKHNADCVKWISKMIGINKN